MKLLVHLHLFYVNQLDYFLKKLENISICFDLFVTHIESFDIQKLKDAFPNANVIKVDNIGWDVYPFLQVLSSVNLDKYDFVLKLHTKNETKILDITPSFNLFSKQRIWRDCLIDPLIGSRDIFNHVLEILKDENVGMVAGDDVICPFDIFSKGISKKISAQMQRLGISQNDKSFVAGTMFLSRANLLKPIVGMFSKEDFGMPVNGVEDMAHVLERVFSMIITGQGKKIKGNSIIPPPNKFVVWLFLIKWHMSIFRYAIKYRCRFISVREYYPRLKKYKFKFNFYNLRNKD